jgi:hypothetical protein
VAAAGTQLIKDDAALELLLIRGLAIASAVDDTGPVSRTLRASLPTALLLPLLAASGCSASPRCPPGASCPSAGPSLTYVLTVNGHTVSFPANGEAPRIRVRAGQQVRINVAVTLPRNLKLMALWLGISDGPYGFTQKHRPANLNPVLAHTQETLAGGTRTLSVRWRIPEHRHGPLLLMSDWSSSQPSAEVAEPIATLTR